MFECNVHGSGERQIVQLVDAEANSSARILPGYGFNCFSFVCRIGSADRDLLYADQDFPATGLKPSHHGTPILAPFPNRIRGGQFQYRSREYQLPCNEQNRNAIHGLVIDQPWRLAGSGTSPDVGAWVEGEIQLSRDLPDRIAVWPSDFRLCVKYALRGRQLRTTLTTENVGAEPMPFGIGTHPYFRFPLDPQSTLADCDITVPASQHVGLINCLPTGETAEVGSDNDLRAGMRLDQRVFDDVFSGLTGDSRLICHYLRDFACGVELEVAHSPEFKFVVIYTPPHRRAICIEPYTCVTDAVNLCGRGFDTGLLELAPGESCTVEILYTVREV